MTMTNWLRYVHPQAGQSGKRISYHTDKNTISSDQIFYINPKNLIKYMV